MSKLDTSEWDALLESLNGQELRKSVTAATRKGAQRIKREAYSRFSSLKTKGKGKRMLGDSSHGGRTLKLVTIHSARKSYNPTVFIHILGNFKAKFFELGTRERYTKGRRVLGYNLRGNKIRSGKGHATGSIIKGNYFGSAIEASRPVASDLAKDISEAIQRTARRKKK